MIEDLELKIISTNIHNHRAFVQLDRMDRLPMTKEGRDLWIACKELQMAFTSLVEIITEITKKN